MPARTPAALQRQRKATLERKRSASRRRVLNKAFVKKAIADARKQEAQKWWSEREALTQRSNEHMRKAAGLLSRNKSLAEELHASQNKTTCLEKAKTNLQKENKSLRDKLAVADKEVLMDCWFKVKAKAWEVRSWA